MADTIASILADITSSLKAGGDLNDVLEKIEKNQQEAFDTKGMEKYVMQLEVVKKKLEETSKAKEDAKKATEELAKLSDRSSKDYQKQLAKSIRLDKIAADAEGKLTDAIWKKNEAYAEAQERMEAQLELTREQWKQNTRLGRTYSFITGSVGKFALGMTAASLAVKAFQKWQKSANLQQQLMIKSFKGFDGARGYAETTAAVASTDSALRKASASAILFGQDVNAVSDYMIRFQRMTGKDNPHALEAMTSATMAAAQVTGVDMAQAMDFVQTRIDKYGGSVSSAILAMESMRLEAKSINNAYGETRLRIDDVINAVNSITSASNIYAVDQDFLTKAISRNMVALQAQGESYDFAKNSATNYMKSLTTGAPEFMKIMSGRDILKDMLDAGSNFEAEFGAELEKAKPGLSKKIQEVLKSDKSQYDKSQLIQQMTEGLNVGLTSMRDKLLDLAGPGGKNLQVIKSIYNVSEIQAQKMIEQAQASKKLDEEKKAIKGASFEEAQKMIGKDKEGYKLSREAYEASKGNLGDLLVSEKTRLDAAEARKVNDKEQLEASEEMVFHTSELAKLEKERASAIKGKGGEEVKQIEAAYDRKILATEKSIADASTRAGKDDEMSLRNYSNKVKGMMDSFNKITGKSILAFAEEWSGAAQTAALAAIYWAFGKKLTNIFSKAARDFENAMSGAGGGGGGGGGYGSDRHNKTRKKRRKQVSRGRNRKRMRGKGKWGKIAALASTALPFLASGGEGGMMDTVSEYGGMAMDFGGDILSKGKGLLSKGGTAIKGAGSALKGSGGSFLKGIGKKGLGKIPYIGGLLYFGMNMMSGEGLGRSAFKAVGSTLGGIGGGALGTLAMPGVGTAVGGIAGAAGGDYLGGKIADFFGFEDPEAMAKGTSGNVVKALSSGGIAGAAATAGAGANELVSGGLTSQGGDIILRIPRSQAGQMGAHMQGLMNTAPQS